MAANSANHPTHLSKSLSYSRKSSETVTAISNPHQVQLCKNTGPSQPHAQVCAECEQQADAGMIATKENK